MFLIALTKCITNSKLREEKFIEGTESFTVQWAWWKRVKKPVTVPQSTGNRGCRGAGLGPSPLTHVLQRAPLLKVPKHSQTSGNQVFKHMSLWGQFTSKPQQISAAGGWPLGFSPGTGPPRAMSYTTEPPPTAHSVCSYFMYFLFPIHDWP